MLNLTFNETTRLTSMHEYRLLIMYLDTRGKTQMLDIYRGSKIMSERSVYCQS